MGLALDASHDLYASGGRIALVAGADAIAQSIETRLLLFSGEFYLDTDAGFPWREEVFISSPDRERIESLAKAEILSVDNVRDLREFSMTIDPQTRQLRIEFVVDTTFGTASGGVGG